MNVCVTLQAVCGVLVALCGITVCGGPTVFVCVCMCVTLQAVHLDPVDDVIRFNMALMNNRFASFVLKKTDHTLIEVQRAVFLLQFVVVMLVVVEVVVVGAGAGGRGWWSC